MGLPPRRDLARPRSTPAKSGSLDTRSQGNRWLSAARSHVGTGELFIHSAEIAEVFYGCHCRLAEL